MKLRVLMYLRSVLTYGTRVVVNVVCLAPALLSDFAILKNLLYTEAPAYTTKKNIPEGGCAEEMSLPFFTARLGGLAVK